MPKYSLTESNFIPNSTKIAVLELRKNNESLFEAFYEEVRSDGNLMNNLAAALRIIEDTANLIRKPQKKFKEIKGHNLSCKLYEAKSGIIRVYLFHEEKTGRIIVTGGVKDNQDKDLRSVKKIIKEYQNER